MKLSTMILAALLASESGVWAAGQQVAVRLPAMVGGEKFACGHTCPGIGTTASTISPLIRRLKSHARCRKLFAAAFASQAC